VHGKYASDDMYGDGDAGAKIAEILVNSNPKLQKTITY